MSAEIVSVADGTLTVRFTGKLAHAELAELQKAAAAIFDRHTKLRLLVIAEDFQGWEREGAWGDLSFQIKYDRKIERMAIACDERWENLALLFTSKGFRRFPIQYFPLAQLDSARAWLLAEASASVAKAKAEPQRSDAQQ